MQFIGNGLRYGKNTEFFALVRAQGLIVINHPGVKRIKLAFKTQEAADKWVAAYTGDGTG